MIKKAILLMCFFGVSVNAQTITETFGSGDNAFTMDFVTIGNPGNVADYLPYSAHGSVGYTYNLGKYEISRDQIIKANSDGGLGISLGDQSSSGGNGVNRPASGISWNEAARFVNYLNTSKGYQAAYNFTTSGANDNITLWETGQYNGSNQFRHKNAYYFLPSIDEWYKAAYYDPNKGGVGGYWTYPTGSDVAPTPVSEGTLDGTAVYGQRLGVVKNNPLPFTGWADVNNAGGLSSYGTMAQGGNMAEWTESAAGGTDGINDNPADYLMVVGGGVGQPSLAAFPSNGGAMPWVESSIAIRVASIPEPSAFSLLAIGLGGLAIVMRRRS